MNREMDQELAGILQEIAAHSDWGFSFSPYEGPDFSRKCFLFPGQGAGFEGMFKDFVHVPHLKHYLDSADQLAQDRGLSAVSAYILSPESIREEDHPLVKNLCLLTVEVALAYYLMNRGLTPDLVTGHSFGEYAALVVSGIVPFEDMFDIIYQRERISLSHLPQGKMVAVNEGKIFLERALGEMLQRGELHFANFNHPFQTVLSLGTGTLPRLKENLEALKVGWKVLGDVLFPYHCSLMGPVRKHLSDFLAQRILTLSPPTIPFLSGVLKKLIHGENFCTAEIYSLLSSQLTVPCDFVWQVRTIFDAGTASFFEVGPKNILSQFVSRTLEKNPFKVRAIGELMNTVGNGDGERKVRTVPLGPFGQKIFKIFNKVLSEVLGHEVVGISVQDRFQEDLGMDSLKRAEIVFKVLGNMEITDFDQIDTSSFSNVYDLVQFIQNYGPGDRKREMAGIQNGRPRDFRTFRLGLVKEDLPKKCGEEEKTIPLVIVRLREIWERPRPLMNRLRSLFQRPQEGPLPVLVLEGGNRKEKASRDFLGELETHIWPFLAFFRDLLGLIDMTGERILYLEWGEEDVFSPAYRAFFRSLKKEGALAYFKAVRFQQEGEFSADLKGTLSQEIHDPYHEEVIYKNGERFVLRPLEEEPASVKAPERKKSGKERAWLAPGGAKGIGFNLLQNGPEGEDIHLYLAGRSQEHSEEIRGAVQTLRGKFKTVSYQSLDARNWQELAGWYEKIFREFGEIDLVLNSVGLEKGQNFLDKEDRQYREEIGGKVLPAIHLMNLANKYKTNSIFHYSSVVSFFGNEGQSLYSMANAIVNEIALEFPLPPGTLCTSINWPAWDGIGMTSPLPLLQKLKNAGCALLDSREAVVLWKREIDGQFPPERRIPYFLSPLDDSFYSLLLHDHPSLGAEMGEIMGRAELTFKKIIDLEGRESFLKDHRVEGNIIFPAAYSLGFFFQFSRLIQKTGYLIRDFQVHRAFHLDGFKKEIQCHPSWEEGELRIFLKDGSGTEFASAFLGLSSPMGGPPEDLPETHYEYEVKNFYGSRAGFAGPHFQFVTRVWMDRSFNIKLQIDPACSQAGENLGPALYDSAFQALGLIGLIKNHAHFLPVFVGKIRWQQIPKADHPLSIVPYEWDCTQEEIKGNVRVLNRENEVLLVMEGVHLKAYKKTLAHGLEFSPWQRA